MRLPKEILKALKSGEMVNVATKTVSAPRKGKFSRYVFVGYIAFTGDEPGTLRGDAVNILDANYSTRLTERQGRIEMDWYQEQAGKLSAAISRWVKRYGSDEQKGAM